MFILPDLADKLDGGADFGALGWTLPRAQSTFPGAPSYCSAWAAAYVVLVRAD